jgi:hypothetical protein
MSMLDDNMRPTKNPEGALLLSVVVVKYIPISKNMSYLTILGQGECALKHYKETGEVVQSARKHDNHFSKEN